MKIFIIVCVVVGMIAAEKPAPYPAKGWKPQGARLELPRQYGTPKEQRTNPNEVQFTTLTNEYLPPTTTETSNDEDEALRVQGLPAVDSFSQFRKFQKRVEPSNIRTQTQSSRLQMPPAPAFAGQPFLLSPGFAPQFAPVNGQLRERQFGRLEQAPADPKSQVQQLPAQQYGAPPTNEYGVPTKSNDPEVENEQPEAPQADEPEQPQDDQDYDDENVEQSDDPVIAVSNSQTSENAVQDSQRGQFGQYYILLPNNSLQKVRFATAQTDEDRQANGFSAQLRFT